jgi:hypothetical protein
MNNTFHLVDKNNKNIQKIQIYQHFQWIFKYKESFKNIKEILKLN